MIAKKAALTAGKYVDNKHEPVSYTHLTLPTNA